MRHDLPELNSLVRVSLGEGDGDGYASRVEDRQGPVLTVAAPAFAGDLFTTREGMSVVVRWIGERGVFEVDGVLESIDRNGSVLVWAIRTTGEVRLAQRRRFARVPFPEPVTLRAVDDTLGAPAVPATARTDGQASPGVGVDLGEGGIRLHVDTGACQVGQQVVVELRLDDNTFVLPGRVLRTHPIDAPATGTPAMEAPAMGAPAVGAPVTGVHVEETDASASGTTRRRKDEIVVEFDEPVPGEDVIRRWVLRQQVLARRRERLSW